MTVGISYTVFSSLVFYLLMTYILFSVNSNIDNNFLDLFIITVRKSHVLILLYFANIYILIIYTKYKNIYYYILYGIIAGFVHTTALYQLPKRIIDTPTHVVRLT